jgi:hypothetical protein
MVSIFLFILRLCYIRVGGIKNAGFRQQKYWRHDRPAVHLAVNCIVLQDMLMAFSVIAESLSEA